MIIVQYPPTLPSPCAPSTLNPVLTRLIDGQVPSVGSDTLEGTADGLWKVVEAFDLEDPKDIPSLKLDVMMVEIGEVMYAHSNYYGCMSPTRRCR